MTNQERVSTNSDRYRIARMLSLVFHPFVIVVPTMLIALYTTTHNWVTTIQWTLLSFSLVIVPAILFIRRKLQRGEYTDADVSVRQHRFGIYLFGGLCEVICLVLLVEFGAPQILVACFISAILALILGTLITLKTKVSAHMASMAGCMAVLFYISPALGAALFIASLAVGWARIYLKQHKLGQVIGGWTVAVISVIVIFSVYLPRVR